MINREGSGARLEVGEGREWDLHALRTCHVDVVQRVGSTLELGLHLKHYVVLVELGEDGGDLPLAKGGVEGLGDVLRRDAEARSRVAVHYEVCVQAAILLVAGDIAQRRKLAK